MRGKSQSHGSCYDGQEYLRHALKSKGNVGYLGDPTHPQGKKQKKYGIFGGSNPPPKVEGDDCLGELQEVLIQTGADGRNKTRHNNSAL